MPVGQQRLLFTVTDSSIYIFIFVFVCYVDFAVYNCQKFSITIVQGLAATRHMHADALEVIVFTFFLRAVLPIKDIQFVSVIPACFRIISRFAICKIRDTIEVLVEIAHWVSLGSLFGASCGLDSSCFMRILHGPLLTLLLLLFWVVASWRREPGIMVPLPDRLPCKLSFCVTCLQIEWKCMAKTHTVYSGCLNSLLLSVQGPEGLLVCLNDNLVAMLCQ